MHRQFGLIAVALFTALTWSRGDPRPGSALSNGLALPWSSWAFTAPILLLGLGLLLQDVARRSHAPPSAARVLLALAGALLIAGAFAPLDCMPADHGCNAETSTTGFSGRHHAHLWIIGLAGVASAASVLLACVSRESRVQQRLSMLLFGAITAVAVALVTGRIGAEQYGFAELVVFGGAWGHWSWTVRRRPHPVRLLTASDALSQSDSRKRTRAARSAAGNAR